MGKGGVVKTRVVAVHGSGIQFDDTRPVSIIGETAGSSGAQSSSSPTSTGHGHIPDIEVTLLMLGDSDAKREILEAFAASGGISVGIGQCAEDSVEYRTKRLSVKGSELTVRVSDMQGQSNKSKTSEALTEAAGVMLVYDAQVAESFANAKAWYEFVQKQTSELRHKKKIILVGNGGHARQQVSPTEVSAFASKNSLACFETASELGGGVIEAFTEIATQVAEDYTNLCSGKANVSAKNEKDCVIS